MFLTSYSKSVAVRGTLRVALASIFQLLTYADREDVTREDLVIVIRELELRAQYAPTTSIKVFRELAEDYKQKLIELDNTNKDNPDV